MTNPTVCFSDIDCEVIKKRYVVNDQIAIQLVASDSERNILKGTCPGKPVCTATQCIVSEKFSESATAIKDYYENKGVTHSFGCGCNLNYKDVVDCLLFN